MPSSTNIVKGSIVVQNLPDLACFTDFRELLLSLQTFLSVEIPASITNVIISNIQPGDDQRQSLWIRLSNGGNFIGVYFFAVGAWRQVFPQPNGVFWMFGDSRDIPNGYLLVDEDNPHFTTSGAQKIMSNYVVSVAGDFFTYFAVTFEGFG